MSTPYDYEIIERLHGSGRTQVYRAVAGPQRLAVIVKIPNGDFPTFQEIARFKREYAIARRCRHDGVVRPLALLQEVGRWTMIQEDIGGQALDHLLRERTESQSPPGLALADFFDIALQLCAALEVVHAHGVIHKNINPSNLVWNAERRRLQLIDFGIASELGQETQGIAHPATLEGTLPYMAPEQTGRMNRSVDYRADYYAVGATFYELLSGRPPFIAADAMGLVHAHIARAPDWSLPVLDQLPGPLLAVLQRLLEKNAEQRYQSVHGLRADLKLCQALARQPAPAQQPRAALSGRGGQFLVAQKLYGRDGEIDALLGAFERISAGTSEMLLVAGYSGIGKSALVNEVHKPILARRGCFVSGKFDQYRRDVPFASLIQAFQELIRQLLSEPDEALRRWAAKLREALGVHIGVIVELIPELALIVGATLPAPALAPIESQNRLTRLFQHFVQAFSAADHPLVIFLDDLQWADAPTLTLIEGFMRDPHERHLLFIGAYRDNEVAAAHPLMALRDKLLQGGVRLQTLTLSALSEAQVAQLIADTLGAPAIDCAPLTGLCYRKTGANPFFLNQFLQAIHAAGHLRYDHAQDAWRWDIAALENADYTENVVDLLLDRVNRLAPATRQLLHLAACLGNRFELDTLAIACEKSAWDTQRDLWPALKAGLIHPLDQHYKYLGRDAVATRIRYRFLHDRVQQAAYAQAGAGQRQENHLHIARLLYRHAPPELLEQQLIPIVEHFNAGRELIADPAERLQLAALNRRAGIQARRSSAFQAALGHMRIGMALLPDHAWREHADLYLDLQLGAAEAAYLCGEFAAAEAIYPAVLAQCAGALQKIRCILVQSHQYQLQGRLADAIGILRGGLGLLQFDIPADATAQRDAIAAIFADTDWRCAGRDMEELMAAQEMRDPAALAAMQMMQALWMASYYSGQQDLSLLMVMSMTRLSLQQGISDFTSVAYVAYAFFLGHSENDARSHRFGAMALELANRRNNLPTRTLTCLMFAALIQHWTQPLRSCDALYDEAFRCALDSGDFVNVGVVAAVRATDRLILGDCLPDLRQAIERDLVLMRANGQTDLADCTIAAALQPIKCLMGHTRRADSYDDDAFSEARFLAQYGASRLYQAYFYQGKIRNAYFFDGADAEALAGHLDVVARIMRGQAKVPETTFYAALICLRALRREPLRADAGAVLARVEALQASLAAWAAKGPHNCAAKHWLVQAELARYRQDPALAMRCYRHAIAAARDAAYVNIQALGNELCGEFWLEQGEHRVAGVFLRDAQSLYRQWGADGKAAQLGARLEALPGNVPASRMGAAPAFAAGADRRAPSLNATLDLASIVKASQALSNEIGLRKVLRRLIAIVRENSGAQVVRLLLLNDEVWSLEADMAGDGVAVMQARALNLDADGDPQFPLSLLRYVARTGAEIMEDSIALSPRFAADPYVRAQRPGSVMCLPVRQGGQIKGLLYLENNLADASFTAARLEFLRILGAQAMISIAHARLHDSLELRVAERTAQLEEANRRLATLSATDGLTGLANRRHFDEILDSEWARAARSGQPLVVIMIDVDHFKKFNDCYGHQAGDACLKSVARILMAGSRRASDLAARYGGEEFAIVLPNTDADVAWRIAEAMRLSIEMLAMPHQGAAAGKVTISAGVAVQACCASGDTGGLVRVADEALYRAKHGGRNRVVMSEG